MIHEIAMFERSEMKVNYKNIRNNYKILTEAAGGRVIPVIKGNAQNAGAFDTLNSIKDLMKENNVEYVAVATLDEAIALNNEIRANGTEDLKDIKIIVLGVYNPISTKYLEENIITTISSLGHLKRVKDNVEKGQTVKIALALNTGMNRLGLKTIEEIDEVLNYIEKNNHIFSIDIIFSHFANAENKHDYEMQRSKAKKFIGYIRGIRGIHVPFTMSASYAAAKYGKMGFEDYVKIGQLLYNQIDDSPVKGLKDGFSVKSYITQITDVKAGEGVGYGFDFVTKENTKIGVVPLGYADGIPRFYNGLVRIGDKEYPTAGRTCMDQLMVDLGKDSEVELFEVVELFGDKLDLSKIQNKTGFTPIEMVTRVNHRIKDKKIKCFD